MDRFIAFLAGAGFGAAAGRWLNRETAEMAALRPRPPAFPPHELRPVEVMARTQSVLREIRALVVHAEVPDDVLEEKIKAKIARMSARPDSIQVQVEHGKVTLVGTARSEEIRGLSENLIGLRGIKELDNRLEALTPPFTSWDDAEPGSRPQARNPGSYPPSVSLVLAAAGLALTYAGYRLRGGSGGFMVAGGAALLGAGAAGLVSPGAYASAFVSHISESSSWRPGLRDSASTPSP
ncbi:MAG: putative integral rane protein [Fibrobacteres bacterium]|nr:putative integral rane protein [Fibrobacterota bacterium]